jgi:hypothetical protein
MIGSIPSYGDYVRKGSGGPEGTCLVCKYEGPMDHGLTGYMCAMCKSMNVALNLKDGQIYQQSGGILKAAPKVSAEA